MQTALAAADEYVPAPQLEHVALVKAATAVEYVPAGQLEQEVGLPLAYFPAGQASHDDAPWL